MQILGYNINRARKASTNIISPSQSMETKPSRPLKASFPKIELGDSGTRSSYGFILDEYNQNLQGQRAMSVYDEMRKSDGTVKAAIQACTLPIRRAKWFVTAASDDQKDIDAANLVENALFNWMEGMTWNDLVRQALLMLTFGVMPFEKVYMSKEWEGKQYITLRKLAPRLPKSIQSWQLTDGTFGIRQLRQDGANAEIPGSKLLIFVNEKEGDNWWGASVLRAPYKHWYYKDGFYKIDAVAFERQGLGVPHMKMPVGYTESDEAKATQALKNLRANESAYILTPDGYEVEFMDMKASSTRDPKNSIDHHNKQILISVLAQFLELGSSAASGSNALSKDHSDLFIKSMETVADIIASTANNDLVKELVDLNFNDIVVYPKIDYSGITSTDVAAISNAYSSLINSGAIKPIKSDENYMRGLLGLGLATQEDIDEREENAEDMPAPGEKTDVIDDEDDGMENEDDQTEADDTKKKVDPKNKEIKKASEHIHGPHCKHHHPKRSFDDGKGFKSWRPLTFSEKKVAFSNIEATMDALEKAFETDARDLLQGIKDSYMAQINRAINDGDTKMLKELEVKFANDYKQLIKNTMKNAYEYGKNNASTEMGVNPPTTSAKDLARIDLMADSLTTKAMADIEAKGKVVTANTLKSDLNAIQSAAMVDELLNDVVDAVVINTRGLIINESINDGRGRVFEQNQGMIYALQRSAVLDTTTCNFCLSMDGRVIEPTDPWARVGAVHSNCRCIWVEILKDEENPPEVGGVPGNLDDYYGGQPNELVQPPRVMPAPGTLAEDYVKSQKKK